MNVEAKVVRVVCIKDDGRRALFKEYGADDLGQARIDRDALCGFGIKAVIEGGAVPVGDAQSLEARL